MPTTNTKLTAREKRYCRCLMHLYKNTKYNPYAVCTNSVYNRQGVHRKRVVPCSENYLFESYSKDQLLGYAASHKVKDISPSMSHEQITDNLYRFVRGKYRASPPTTKTRVLWTSYLKRYRADHSGLSYAEAVNRASEEYKTMK
jgi:hypothetical protein